MQSPSKAEIKAAAKPTSAPPPLNRHDQASPKHFILRVLAVVSFRSVW